MRNTHISAAVLALSLGLPTMAIAASTQIVVQWDDTQAQHLVHLQTAFDHEAETLGYISDGNDIGGGVINFYLYTDTSHVNDLIPKLVALQNQGTLPAGMRIGVAVYKDSSRKDWTYRPAYPAQLKSFKQ